MESNHRPPPYQGGALPTELREQVVRQDRALKAMVERETGIEPALVAWKATVLPLNYSRIGNIFNISFVRAVFDVLKMVEGGGFEPPKA